MLEKVTAFAAINPSLQIAFPQSIPQAPEACKQLSVMFISYILKAMLAELGIVNAGALQRAS